MNQIIESSPEYKGASAKSIRELSLDFSRPFSPNLAEEIEKQAAYVSKHLLSLKVGTKRDQISLTYDSAGKEDEQILRGKVERFVNAMVTGYRELDTKVVLRNERRDTGPLEGQVYEKLLARGWVVELGHGQVALSGPALALATAVEQHCSNLGRESFGAQKRSYPTLIPTEALARCGYTSSFPQHLSMVTHLREDFDAIERFRKANVDRGLIQIPDPDAVGEPDACLCPALCYHAYPTLEGQKLDTEGHVETSIGRICRYESSNITGLDRLWEFTQRSIIWLGGSSFCETLRDRSIAAVGQQVAEWDIECTIETANDPFFAAISTAKSFWQRAQDLKLELRATIEPGKNDEKRTIAACSFNLHGVFFGNAFDIKAADGSQAFSGCASWGLERWVLVMFTQHGFDKGRWPQSLRSIFDE